jgi:flagellar biosynthetic protein FliQ
MTDATVLEIGLRAAIVGAELAAPILLTSLVIGLGVGLVQSVTQLQDVTLSFVPKLIGVGVALMVFGAWMLREITGFTTELYGSIPQILQGG